jgi:hypothetical protein
MNTDNDIMPIFKVLRANGETSSPAERTADLEKKRSGLYSGRNMHLGIVG